LLKIGLITAAAAFFVLIHINVISVWNQLRKTNCAASLMQLFIMNIRHLPIQSLADLYILAADNNIAVTYKELANYYQQGINVGKAVDKCIELRRDNIDINLAEIIAEDSK